MSTCRRCCLQLSEEGAGEVAFEAADGVAFGFSFAEAAADVGLRFGVDSFAAEDDRVEGAVELAVVAAVEAVADGFV